MRWGVAAVLVLALTAGGCGFFSKKPAPIEPVVGATQAGIASWYGPGFHGRRTANGETYNQYALTAAHRTLPHGTRVRVTNQTNARSVQVRINDRGPYVDDRVIDLSYAAAARIGMIGPGTAPVQLEILDRDPGEDAIEVAEVSPPPPALPPAAPPASGPVQSEPPPAAPRYAVHAGTYADYQRARREQQRLSSEVGRVHLAMVEAREARYFQLRVGPFEQRDQAVQIVRRLAALGVPALLVTNTAAR